MKFCTDIHDPQKMNPTDFGDPLTFPVVGGTTSYFSMKYLNYYWIDCDEIWFSHSCSPQDEL